MLSINVSEVVWTIVCFFLLYFLLKRFLYDPVVSFMDDRRERIDSKLRAERDALALREENERKVARELAESRASAASRLQESAAQSEQKNADLAKQARKTAAEAREESIRRAEQEGEEAFQSFCAHRDELAALLAEKLVGRAQN